MKALDDTVIGQAAQNLDNVADHDQRPGQPPVLARMPDLSEVLEEQGHEMASDATTDQNRVDDQEHVAAHSAEVETVSQAHEEEIAGETSSATSGQYDTEPLRRFAVPFGGTLLAIAVLALIALALRNRTTPSSQDTNRAQWPEIAELQTVPSQAATENDAGAEDTLNEPPATPEISSDVAQSKPDEDSTVLVDHVSTDVTMGPPLAETTEEIPISQSHYSRQPATDEGQLADNASGLTDHETDSVTQFHEGTSTRLSLGGPIAQQPQDTSKFFVQPNPSETYQRPPDQTERIRDLAREPQDARASTETGLENESRSVAAPITFRHRYPSTGFPPQNTSIYESRRDFDGLGGETNRNPGRESNGYRDSSHQGWSSQGESRPADNKYVTPNSNRYHELNR